MKRESVRLMAAVLVALCGLTVAGQQNAAPCIDRTNDPAGCQPSPFDTPFAQMPSVRVNAEGKIDPFASEADARKGFALLEKELHLFRNFEHLHWVITVPSVKDPATGAWRGGDLEGAGDGRGLGTGFGGEGSDCEEEAGKGEAGFHGVVGECAERTGLRGGGEHAEDGFPLGPSRGSG